MGSRRRWYIYLEEGTVFSVPLPLDHHDCCISTLALRSRSDVSASPLLVGIDLLMDATLPLQQQ